VDPIELFEFYDVYLSVTEKKTSNHLNCLPIGLKHSCRILMKLIVIFVRFILCFILFERHYIKKWGIEVENTTT
jgi:hypothetical protein